MSFDQLPKMTGDEGFVDGATLRQWIHGFEIAAGRFPNVLMARTLAEGMSIRTVLLTAMWHHRYLEANLEVRADGRMAEGVFYLTVDEDKKDQEDLREARREAVRSGGENL